MRKNKKTDKLVLFFIAIFLSSCSRSEAASVSSLDPKASEKALEIFKSGDVSARTSLIGEITSHPEAYIPIVYFVMANELHSRSDADSAITWFLLGSLRSNIELARCTDQSAKQAVQAVASTSAESLMPPLRSDAARGRKLLAKTLEMEEKMPFNAFGYCETRTPSESDSAGINTLAKKVREDFKLEMNKAFDYVERQSAGSSNQRNNLRFAVAGKGEVVNSAECPKETASVKECKSCCAGLESELSEAQANEVIERWKSPDDLLSFSFKVPEKMQNCVVQCGFADITRQIAK